MSGHEQERLSAFLDGELAPAERAVVEQHLAGCAECQARLGELAAADRAAAALPAEAPAGYFESLPSRVRARLDARPARRGLPAWTWAAAAALLLAVVTPLTLSRRPATDQAAAPPAAPPPALERAIVKEQATSPTVAQAPAPPAAAAPVAAPAAREAEGSGELAYGEPAEKKSEARRRATAPEPAPLAARQEGFAAAPQEEEDARAAGAMTRPLEPQANAPAREAVVSEEKAARALDEAAPLAPAGAEVGDVLLRSQPKAARDALASSVQPKDDAHAPAAAGVAAAPRPVALEADWQRLDSARPSTAAEWRELREAWRRFAARRPDGPRADEARVRVVEAGREAWRASGEPADEAVFRRDAAAYLAREDAAQPERVRRLLR